MSQSHTPDPSPSEFTTTIDPFEDDTPLECGLENADICESCQ